MCRRDARICATLEDRGEEVAMLFPVRTPVCRQLRQDSVIVKSEFSVDLFQVASSNVEGISN